MLIAYVLCLLLTLGCGVAYVYIKKPMVSYIVLGAGALMHIASMVLGWHYGRYFFRADDATLGGWIFLLGGLLIGLISGFIATYKRFELVSKILLGCAFALAIALIVMCIFEAKVSFANGIGENSPIHHSSNATSSDILLIFYTLY